MIYLKEFSLVDEDKTYKSWSKILSSVTNDESYPLGLFQNKLQNLEFNDITIFYGGNGSGKSTLLNLIGETLDIQRMEEFNRTAMFDFFVKNNSYKLNTVKNNPIESQKLTKNEFQYMLENYNPEMSRIPSKSKFIASDDIFKHILNIRENNKKVKFQKDKESHYHGVVNSITYSDFFGGGVSIDMEDKKSIEAFNRYMDARSKTGRKFIKSRVGEMERQYSNGENALMYFDKQIEENALYLLDEPENSLSPQFQIQLKILIEDSVRYKNCQFIIATHSPFILALQHAKIYNLDAIPVSIENWYQLENMKIYYEFFKLFQFNFEE